MVGMFHNNYDGYFPYLMKAVMDYRMNENTEIHNNVKPMFNIVKSSVGLQCMHELEKNHRNTDEVFSLFIPEALKLPSP